MRRFKNGPRPGIANVNKDSQKSWKWSKNPEDYTAEEKKKLILKLVEVAVRSTFEMHVYQWEGIVF